MLASPPAKPPVSVRSTQGYLGVDVRDAGGTAAAIGTSDSPVSAINGAVPAKDLHGAEIVRLDHDGPACKAGMREHDVVVSMDGNKVDGQESFRRMLHETQAGRSIVLVVLRDGQQQSFKATMANREEVERQAWQQHIAVIDPDQPGTPAAQPGGRVGGHVGGAGLGFLHGSPSVAAPAAKSSRGFLGTGLGAPPYTGAWLEPVGPQLGEFFGVQSGVGLLVKSIDANSPAAIAGLHAGDVVIKAGATTISTENDWARLLHENRGKAMPLLVLRDKKEQTIVMTPDAKRKAAVDVPSVLPDRELLARMNLLGGQE